MEDNDDSQNLLSPYYLLGSFPRVFHVWTHFILTKPYPVRTIFIFFSFVFRFSDIEFYYFLLTDHDTMVLKQSYIITIVKDVYQFSQSIARPKKKKKKTLYKETEAQRGQVICARSHSYKVADVEDKSRYCRGHNGSLGEKWTLWNIDFRELFHLDKENECILRKVH